MSDLNFRGWKMLVMPDGCNLNKGNVNSESFHAYKTLAIDVVWCQR